MEAMRHPPARQCTAAAVAAMHNCDMEHAQQTLLQYELAVLTVRQALFKHHVGRSRTATPR